MVSVRLPQNPRILGLGGTLQEAFRDNFIDIKMKLKKSY